MLPESLMNNKKLIEELLESDYFENSDRLKKTRITPEKTREYLRTSINESPAKARGGLEELQAIALEAIIKLAERPALQIIKNSFQPPRTKYWKYRLEPFRTTIDRAIKSVGRIEVENHPEGFLYVGTGWLVTDDIIVTNRHVAKTFAILQSGSFKFKQNPSNFRYIESNIDFVEEFKNPEQEELKIKEILYIESESGSDIAFLRVNRIDDITPRAKIALAKTIPGTGSEIAVIGYPARDSRRNPVEPSILLEIFEDIYDVKRLQPGEILSAARLEEPVPLFIHDCSTLGGNSGSVVLDFRTGEAIGLHFGGIFQRENYAVPSTVIEQRLNDLLSGKLTIPSLNEDVPFILHSSPIDSETVDNETSIQLEDTPCICPLDDQSLENRILEVPFPAVNTQLELSGTGYYSYAKFREKQFGLPETIQAIEEIGKMWAKKYSSGLLIGVGNISKQGGGLLPPHKSHQTGLDVDFRLLRKDGKRIGVTFRDPNYSPNRTQDLIDTIRNNSVLSVKLILFNDNKLKGVQPWPNHDDHLHVRFTK